MSGTRSSYTVPLRLSGIKADLSTSFALQVWINQGDIILLSLRDFQDDKADVIQKYTVSRARGLGLAFMLTFRRISQTDEARNLKAYGELPETAKINETDTFGPGEVSSTTSLTFRSHADPKPSRTTTTSSSTMWRTMRLTLYVLTPLSPKLYC